MSTPAPTPDPGPDPADPADAADATTGVSRRVLLGGGLLVLGAVGGGAVGFARTEPRRRVVPDPVAPADLLAAIGRETALLATYDAALTAGANPLWSAVRSEHAAHVEALTALLPAGATTPATAASTAPSTGPSAASSASPPAAGPPPGAADLVAAETAAAAAARAACLAGNGAAAVLLACIAASEDSHAVVLA